MNFNDRLRQLRIKNNLNQSQLADILGVKPSAISNYESSRNEPSFDKLISLSRYFDVSCDYLLGVTDAYLPVGGEVLDKNIVDFFEQYKKLNPESVKDIQDYIRYLLFKQNHSSHNK